MVFTDETPLFRSLISKRLSSLPPSARSKSPLGRGRSSSHHRDRKGKSKDHAEQDEFLKEAYRIHNHLFALSQHLIQIRKPYLSSSSAPSVSRRYPRPASSSKNQDRDEEGLPKWEGSKYLTDRERDEIDLRARIILRRCRERVSLLEDGEKARQKIAHPPASSALFTILPSLAPPSSSANRFDDSLLAAHRASVIWTLNDMLARNSAVMSGLQEERGKRREERSRTLGAGAAREAAQLNRTTLNGTGNGVDGDATVDPEIEGLSAAQIQQFESQNNTLLTQMQSQLTSVLSAEKSLLEISTLQTELVRHLVTQTEMTDRLYDEAVGSVGEVGRANEQLRKARRRGEEGRLFLLVFLVGASLALLFLNWYA